MALSANVKFFIPGPINSTNFPTTPNFLNFYRNYGFWQQIWVSINFHFVFQKFPIIQFYLKWFCFAYLLYLGWQIIGSFANDEKETGRPLRFYEAALFQFINPKAWVVALTASTAFFPNEESFIVATSFVAITAPFICLPAICIWVVFGASIRSIIKNTKIKKIIEYLLALLLVVTAVIIVID